MAAFVSLGSPRKLLIYHLKTSQQIQSLSYTNSILSVRMNRQRLLVCLEDCIYVHSIKDFSVQHVIRDTPANTRGLMALAPSCENCLLAYPSNATTGEVAIFDLQSCQNKILIPAHDNALACLAFNSTGTRLATASEKGTVIRVFQVHDGQMLYEFRRGYARCVSICSLNFSSDSAFLAASSNTQTVHIFKLEDPDAL
jgi:autophagy-related protein 18